MNRAGSPWIARLVVAAPHWSQPQYRMLIFQQRTMATWMHPTFRCTTPSVTTTKRSISFFSKKPSADEQEEIERKNKKNEYEAEKKKSSVFDHLTGYFHDRSEKENQAKLLAQVELMAETEVWTLENFEKVLDDQLKTWGAKLSWLSGNKDLKLAKQAQSVVKLIIELVGKNATSEKIEEIGRREKLKISYQSGASLEDINMLFMQFQTSSLMHKVIRHRKVNGKKLPHDADTLKLAMNMDGRGLLTRKEMQAWKTKSLKNARSMLKSKRSL